MRVILCVVTFSGEFTSKCLCVCHDYNLQFLCRCDKLQLKNKHLTETNLELFDKMKNAKEEKNNHIEQLEANYEKLEKIKQETDESGWFNCTTNYCKK